MGRLDCHALLAGRWHGVTVEHRLARPWINTAPSHDAPTAFLDSCVGAGRPSPGDFTRVFATAQSSTAQHQKQSTFLAHCWIHRAWHAQRSTTQQHTGTSMWRRVNRKPVTLSEARLKRKKPWFHVHEVFRDQAQISGGWGWEQTCLQMGKNLHFLKQLCWDIIYMLQNLSILSL